MFSSQEEAELMDSGRDQVEQPSSCFEQPSSHTGHPTVMEMVVSPDSHPEGGMLNSHLSL